MKKLFFLLALSAGIWACGDTHTHAEGDDHAHHDHDGHDHGDHAGHDHGDVPMTFGEEITADGAIALSELVANMDGKDEIQAKVSGTVEAVCKKKGCWMNLVDGENEVFVKFKDYGFFMPLDCEGQKLVMQGTAKVEETSVEELRHYAEDEGKSKEEIAAITEPKKELTFLADGVVFVE